MSSIGAEKPVGAAPAAGRRSYLTDPDGALGWVFTLDHKRIGVLYLVSVLTSFLLGGIFALLVRTELLTPQQTVMDADTYNRMFTAHGAVMIFLFLIPAIPASLGNFVLPIMLGAKDVAFPRLNLLSYYIYVLGMLFALTALVTTGVDTGWTFYTPYSTTTNTNVIAMTMGAFILGFSSILTGLNFIVTIHKLRPRNMGWFEMPLFLWSLYATSVIQILATPVLAITLLLLSVERAFGIGIFDPALGGDPVLYQHFFWFYSHPAVYLMILPAMGVMSELISVFSRKPIFGYKFIAYSSVAIAIIGFLVWGHHLFTSGQSNIASTIFSFLTMAVAIPSAIKMFNWLATLYKGSIHFDTPMIYALSFFWLFLIGGLTGLFVATMSVDVHLHDTYFVVAHFHYVMVGGTLFAFLGGLHYWWPKMFGRMYSEKVGRTAALLLFAGFNLTFFVQFLIGGRGMPRRYYNYPEQFTTGHVISTIGSYVTAVALFMVLGCLVHSLVRGRRAPDNPWGGASMEWFTSSPPPHYNFDAPPEFVDRYDFSTLRYDEAIGGWIELPAADQGEGLNAMSDAAATSAGHGHGPHLQHHFDTPEQQMESGKLGMWLFLAQELLFFGGLFCAYAIYRASHPEMFAFGSSMLNWKMGAFNTVVLICSSLTMAWAVRSAQIGNRKLLMWMLIATQVFAGVFLVVKYFEYGEKIEHGLLWGTHFEPSPHTLAEHGWTLPAAAGAEGGTGAPGEVAAGHGAEDAEHNGHPVAALAVVPANGHIFFGIYFIMTGLHLLHVLAGMAVIAWLMFGAAKGVYGPGFFNPVDIVGLYWHLVDLVWIFLFPLLYLI